MSFLELTKEVFCQKYKDEPVERENCFRYWRQPGMRLLPVTINLAFYCCH